MIFISGLLTLFGKVYLQLTLYIILLSIDHTVYLVDYGLTTGKNSKHLNRSMWNLRTKKNTLRVRETFVEMFSDTDKVHFIYIDFRASSEIKVGTTQKNKKKGA